MRLLCVALLWAVAARADDVADVARRIVELARKEAPLPRAETVRRAEALLRETRPELAHEFRGLELKPELVNAPAPVVLNELPSDPKALEQAVARLVDQVEHSGDDPASYDKLAAIIRKNGLSAGLDNPSIRARIALAELDEALHPDYVLMGLDGKQVRLSDFRGKRVMLTFWATWCIPCRAELARMERMRAASKDVVALAVSHEPVETVREFLAAHPYRVPVYIDEGHKLSDHFQIDMIPATVVIGADGRRE
jgi:peroxiredoxin